MSEYATKITDEIEKDWIAALRSGKYKQYRGALESIDRDSYCCLGVLGKVLKAKGLAANDVNESDVPYDMAMARYGLSHHLVDWNDGDKEDFATIADRIEKKQTNVRHPEA